jgi:hypothetical protein
MGGLGTGLKSINWDTANLPKFEKNFYIEDKRVTARSDREVDEFRRKWEMKVKVIFYFDRDRANQLIRFKDVLYLDRSLLLKRLVFQNTLWQQSGNRDSPTQHLSSARHGRWPLVVVM